MPVDQPKLTKRRPPTKRIVAYATKSEIFDSLPSAAINKEKMITVTPIHRSRFGPGSTGYSLSCGGPVIAPSAKSLVLTPIAPHNLNARPLVISDDTQIRLKVSGREENHLVSLDSRIASIANGKEIRIKKSDFTVKMIEYKSESFLKTLRNKLLWGQDKRN